VPIRGRGPCFSDGVRHWVRSLAWYHPPSFRAGSFPPRRPQLGTPALFGRFTGTTTPSDSSPLPRRLRLLGFPSRP
jgi:hypothetical protein